MLAAHCSPRCGLRGRSVQSCHKRMPSRRVALDVCSAAKVEAPADPFAEKEVYTDNFFDKLFIKIYSEKMAAQLQGVYVPPEPQYDDFVRISNEIMKGRTPEQQKVVVNNVLKSLLPAQAPAQFRKLFPPTKLSAELNAAFAALGFGWLVGKMELQSADVEVAPGEKRTQKSVVYIKKCRYLETSGCVGMCVNMCKVPTQDFFTQDFGLPLTMEPNFEDLSCKMIFGQAPLPLPEDPASRQPCFALHCSLADKSPKPCPKVSVGSVAVEGGAAA